MKNVFDSWGLEPLCCIEVQSVDNRQSLVTPWSSDFNIVRYWCDQLSLEFTFAMVREFIEIQSCLGLNAFEGQVLKLKLLVQGILIHTSVIVF